MGVRAIFLACLCATGALFAGCPATFEVAFDHRLKGPPPRVMVSAGYQIYNVGDWVEFEALEAPPADWVAYKWVFIRNAVRDGKDIAEPSYPEMRYRQDTDTGVELADRVWARFSDPGLYTVMLAVAQQKQVVCPNRKCRQALPNLPYREGSMVPCPGCKTLVPVPSVPVDAMGRKIGMTANAFVSAPEKVMILKAEPRRFRNDNPFDGDDLPIVKVFPSEGWVYVGERFSVSLLGVKMYTDTGVPTVYMSAPRINRVQVDFGDGSKVEEYALQEKQNHIEHQLISHIYTENGVYEINVSIFVEGRTDPFRYDRSILSVYKPTSGLQKLVTSVVETLMKSKAGSLLKDKNIIIYNLANLDTYSDDVSIYPIEDEMVQQFHKAGVHVLERDEEILRRWAPEVFGMLPNTFSPDLALFTPADLKEYGENLLIETARPDYLIEYRIVELNERFEPYRKFNPRTNAMEDVIELAGKEEHAAGMETASVHRLQARWRKLILKLYFRIIDGKKGPESTRVLFTDTLIGGVDDFVVVDSDARFTRTGPKGTTMSCPNCTRTLSFSAPVSSGQSVKCGACGHVFPVK